MVEEAGCSSVACCPMQVARAVHVAAVTASICCSALYVTKSQRL